MKQFVRCLMVLCMLVPGVSWGKDYSIKKPQFNNVRTIAIISLYANASIQKLDSRAGSISAMGSLLKKSKDGGASSHFGGAELIDYTLDVYTAALGGVNGWTVINPKTMLETPAFKAFIEDYRTAVGPKGMEMMGNSYTAPAGMSPMLRIDKKLTAKIKDLCAALNVDAVAIVDVNLGQQSTTVTVGATGKVWPAVAGSLRIINKDGEYAVFELPADSMTRRSRPQEAVSMTLDTVSDNAESRSAYKEAIKIEAEYSRDHLNKALEEK